eukprot:Skav201370  [mRNA]  locus=scaffold176:378756:387063:- [translate_table: standard]
MQIIARIYNWSHKECPGREGFTKELEDKFHRWVFSYDALTKSPEVDAHGYIKEEQETSIHSLLIMPMFQLIITQNPVLFRSSLVFVVLAMAIMTLESCGLLFWNLFMTHQSRVVFIGVSVIQGCALSAARP